MRRYLWATLLLSAISCPWSGTQERVDVGQDNSLTGPILTFDPAHQKPVSYLDKSVRINLVIGKERDSINILIRATGVEKRVDLPDEIAQVDEIRVVVGNKIVVRGMVNGSGSEIAIIDIPSARQIDKFVCYGPSVSPDGRYIAFIKFYPGHFAEGTEDHYMLYDLEAGPADNRPLGTGADNWLIVGRCIYPIGCGNVPGDNNGVMQGSQHSSRSEFHWNPKKEEVFFADQVDSDDPIKLVLARIGPDEKVTLRTAEQNTNQLCPSGVGGSTPCSLLVRKVEFKGGTKPAITAVFEIVERQQLKAVEYSAANFRPES